jgi:peptide/nickel transport system substrate-binding protein
VALAGAALLAAACGERPDAASGGTIVIATSAAPERLHPALVASIGERQLVDLLFDRLARLGPSLDPTDTDGFTPQLATAWRWAPDSASVTFTLDPAARWHDGLPLRAADVTFSFALLRDPATGAPMRGDLAMVDSLTAPDSLTVTAWFRAPSPFAFHDLVMALVPVPQHRWADVPRDQLLTNAPLETTVGSGRFRLGEVLPGQRITLVADSTHPRGRPQPDRVIWRVLGDPAARLAALRSGEVDVIQQPGVDVVRALADAPDVRVRLADAFEYSYLQFNLFVEASAQPHPLLGDRALRRALALGTDAEALTRAALDSLGRAGRGPFVARQFGALTEAPTPTDTAAAAQALDAGGWTRGPEGLRARGGTPLALTVIVPASSATGVRLAELLQAQWRALGVDLRVDVIDPALMGERMRGRRFELALGTIRTGVTPSGLTQSWGSAGAAPGGRNVGRYTSVAFDAAVDSALRTRDPAAARALFGRAYRTLLDDAPAVFLAETATTLALRSRLDVPALRGDAWWFDLADWRVRADTPTP